MLGETCVGADGWTEGPCPVRTVLCLLPTATVLTHQPTRSVNRGRLMMTNIHRREALRRPAASNARGATVRFSLCLAALLLASALLADEPKVHRDLPYAEPKNKRHTLDVYA